MNQQVNFVTLFKIQQASEIEEWALKKLFERSEYALIKDVSRRIGDNN